MASCDNVRRNLLFLAKIAEKAERYEDMLVLTKKIVNLNVNLSEEERRILRVSYKKPVEARQASLYALHSCTDQESNELKSSYIRKIEMEMEYICNDAIAVSEQLISSLSAGSFGGSGAEALVSYHKMRGDYNRYLSEVKSGDEWTEVVKESLRAYKAAMAVVEQADLPSTHPFRLSLALNTSVLYHDVLGYAETACHLAKLTLDKAMTQIHKVNKKKNANYEDSITIMQLLNNNLALWTVEDDPEESINVAAAY